MLWNSIKTERNINYLIVNKRDNNYNNDNNNSNDNDDKNDGNI